jgi:hypothetical protein
LTIFRSDGTVYEGEFVKDQPEGKGVMTEADGTVASGFWKAGELVEEKIFK